MEHLILISPRNSEESGTIQKILKALKVNFVTKPSSKKTDITNPEIIAELETILNKKYSDKSYITIKDTNNIWESILSK